MQSYGQKSDIHIFFPDILQPCLIGWDMRLATALVLGLMLAFQRRNGLSFRVPTKDMMIRGLTVFEYIKDMSLMYKGIQYIPENTFIDFPNLTV